IAEYDLESYRQTALYTTAASTVPGIGGLPDPLVSCGHFGLATIDNGLSGTQYKGIFIYRLNVLEPLSPVDLVVVRSVGSGISVVSAPNSSITYDEVSNRIFASVPSHIPWIANSVVAIKGDTLETETP